MSQPLTSKQAIDLLRKNPEHYTTQEQLRALAAQVDADAPGKLTTPIATLLLKAIDRLISPNQYKNPSESEIHHARHCRHDGV